MTHRVEQSLAPPRVLVIDDDPAMCSLLHDGLQQQGYQVVVAADGSEALAQLEHSFFDAAVLDLEMAPVGGWEVVRHLEGMVSQTVIIVLSAHVDVPATVTALRAGVFDVLQKPVRLSELCSRIDAGLKTISVLQADKSERRMRSRFRPGEPSGLGVKRLLGRSTALRHLRSQIENLARFSEIPVLIVGETGTGKELAALAVHDLSSPGAPFVSLNCSAVPEQLFESELFGHEAGAFSGATQSRAGLLELAGEGTLFLDEVAELPDSLQPKLLRALHTRTFRRLGEKRERAFLGRVVSATNQPLTDNKNALRSDLYFRLAGFTIHLPRLCDRIEDVEVLALHFLARFAERYPGLPTQLTDEALQKLEAYSWPGNVRELQTVVEQAAMTAGNIVQGRDVEIALQVRRSDEWETSPPSTRSKPVAPFCLTVQQESSGAFIPQHRSETLNLNEMQRSITIEMYRSFQGNLSQTARALGIPRTTLRDRLKRYGER